MYSAKGLFVSEASNTDRRYFHDTLFLVQVNGPSTSLFLRKSINVDMFLKLTLLAINFLLH